MTWLQLWSHSKLVVFSLLTSQKQWPHNSESHCLYLWSSLRQIQFDGRQSPDHNQLSIFYEKSVLLITEESQFVLLDLPHSKLIKKLYLIEPQIQISHFKQGLRISLKLKKNCTWWHFKHLLSKQLAKWKLHSEKYSQIV